MELASDRRIQRAFKKYSINDSLSTENLNKSLEYLGFDSPNVKGPQNFLQFLKTIKTNLNTNLTINTFKRFDKGKTGTISKSDLASVFVDLGLSPKPNVIEKLFAKVDTNGDGKIEFNEFAQIMHGK